MNLINTYLHYNDSSLKESELIELLELISKSRGFIYPEKLSDDLGFELKEVSKFLLYLYNQNYLSHWIVPKDEERTMPENAVIGFDFDKFPTIFNESDGYYDESINDKLILLSAYKHHVEKRP
ncbi:hypothetical protein [Bacteriovorax sp. BAL6_X]|uniref:hypothetical protein n=1 Tax=Bacteriovorax sp. BAL6_X TaxID=1201290 RepID=UPI0005902D33|nr:hypothetical protein [Bacteriovorax sp. BAL6_X]